MDPGLWQGVLKVVLLPPVGLLLVALIAWPMRRRRWVRRLGGLALAGVLALALPATESFLVRLLDPPVPVDLARARDAQALVIIGGGVRRDAPEYGGDTLGRLTLERVRYGARLARETGLPVLVSGGSLLGARSEAMLMRAALESEYQITVRWIEAESRNTHENAQRSARMLRADGITRVVLVSHSFDAKRAGAEFAREGLQVIAAATFLRAPNRLSWRDFVPVPQAWEGSYYAIYELVALAFMRVTT